MRSSDRSLTQRLATETRTSDHDWHVERLQSLLQSQFNDPYAHWSTDASELAVTAYKKHGEYNDSVFKPNYDDLPALPEYKRGSVTFEWESVVKNSRTNFVVGFIDLVATVTRYELGLFRKNYSSPFEWSAFKNQHKPHAFEIKTFISSIGDVIRQIQMYRTFDCCRDYLFYLAGPKHVVNRYSDLLKTQNIYVYPTSDEKQVGRGH